MNERDAARQLSEALDQLVSQTGSVGADPAGRPATAVPLESGMSQAIARLSALPVLLPAPDAAFEQRVWQRVRASANTNMNPTSISGSGGGQPHDNMLPFVTLNFCIALEGIYPSQS